MNALEVFVGRDPREAVAYDVTCFSLIRRTSIPLAVQPIDLVDVQRRGLYTRPSEWRGGQRWCPISDAPMSTDFAISRFLVPWLVQGGIARIDGWAVFMDGDMLARRDAAELMRLADPRYAVMVVKHDYRPADARKMDDQIQTTYARKAWSSLVLWNLGHIGNRGLSLEMVNTLPGRDLHRFCWLQDHEIGALPEAWNWLEGHSPAEVDPALVHLTRGGPWLPAWRHVAYAADWEREREIMDAAEGRRIAA